LQALVLLNDPTYVEASRKLAERILSDADSSAERLSLAFRIVLCREPNATEFKVLLGLLDQAQRKFAADPSAASKLLAIGQSPRDERFDPADHAAWTTVCTTLLNLDEAISKP
jgi:hypothetical protein